MSLEIGSFYCLLHALRNITGELTGPMVGGEEFFYSGAFTGISYSVRTGNNRTGVNNGIIEFSANTNTRAYGNPMAGHANSDNIHPYNVRLIPLIAY